MSGMRPTTSDGPRKCQASGDVIVISEWQGTGTGTLKLVIMDSNGSTANQDILDAVYDHIMGTNDPSKRLAPPDTILTVVTATLKTINIAATVLLSPDVTIDPDTHIASNQAIFEARVKAYFPEAKADGSIRYTRIGSILSETEGVIDYSSLTINSGTANITIADDEYPSLGTVTWTVT